MGTGRRALPLLWCVGATPCHPKRCSVLLLPTILPLSACRQTAAGPSRHPACPCRWAYRSGPRTATWPASAGAVPTCTVGRRPAPMTSRPSTWSACARWCPTPTRWPEPGTAPAGSRAVAVCRGRPVLARRRGAHPTGCGTTAAHPGRHPCESVGPCRPHGGTPHIP